MTLLFGAAVQSQTADRRFLILLIGPTGSGKSTQAQFLQKRFGIPTVAVDDLIQENAATLAKDRRPGITPGPPQLNPAIDRLIAEKLARLDLNRGVVLDGYPASKDQADHLAELAKKLNLAPAIVIQIDLPDDAARQRLKERGRAVDTPDLIEERLKNYRREMVNGDKPVAEVSSTIEVILKDEIPKQ